MKTRYYALIMGIIFAVIGVAGFIPGLLTPHDPPADLAVNSLSGNLLGLFPVNILHSLVHLLFGIWGIAAYRSFTGARAYAKSVAVIYGVLTIMGFIPGLSTVFGLVPLYGNDIWLHALIAISAAYFGFMATETVRDRDTVTYS
jgi:Domain of unknown function (DUF4383)